MESLLAEATERSKTYECMAAAELYRKATDELDSADTMEEFARLSELLGTSYYKGAFQAESREEFKRSMQLSQEAFERAGDSFRKAGFEGRGESISAKALFTSYWISDALEERRRVIERCIEASTRACGILQDRGDGSWLAEAKRELQTYNVESMFLAVDASQLSEAFDRALTAGKEAKEEYEKHEESLGLLESMCTTLWLMGDPAGYAVDPTRFREFEKQAEDLRERIAIVSERIGTPQSRSLAHEAYAWMMSDREGRNSEALVEFKAALENAEMVGDSLLMGRICAGIVYSTDWSSSRVEDFDERRKMLSEAIPYSTRAEDLLQVPLSGAWLQHVYNFRATAYFFLANVVETEVEKRKYLIKSIEVGREGRKYAAYSAWFDTLPSFDSVALSNLAGLERDPEIKSKRLREALSIQRECLARIDIVIPGTWDPVLHRNFLGRIQAELSKLSQSPQERIELLKSALLDMQQSMESGIKWANDPDKIHYLADHYEKLGDTLLEFYRLTDESEAPLGAVNAYREARSSLQRTGGLGALPTLSWKIAKVFDLVADYKTASETFQKAAEEYQSTAGKISSLAANFRELAYYMKAWALIEQARLSHVEAAYSTAEEYYMKAADALASTKTWTQLFDHYKACSLLEQGEDFGRREESQSAIESFASAVKAFQAAEGKLKERLGSHPQIEEEQELEKWLKINDDRKRYCSGRMSLEEAKAQDKQGQKAASAKNYVLAAEAFREIQSQAEGKQERRELESLVLSCEAWAKMKQGEASSEPKLYAEAAELFRKAVDSATSEKYRLLSLANASMCRALEAGTRFRMTRDTELYSEIKRQLATAADYYGDAGWENGADWTRATQRLFDALVYLADAEVEKESAKKGELYGLAEKHLELAAKLYKDAGFSAKRDETLRYLKGIREEKEILSPSEALSGNPAVSGTPVAPVSLVRDQALGLERYESANIVGHMSHHPKELHVGSDLTVELEIANVGKTAATLLKLENVAPEGLELDRERIAHRVEDSFIPMKGKRLEYLKTDEVKIALRAMRKGAFELKPRVLFVDETGNYKSYDFEPVTLTVRELGVSGWIKGSSK